MKGKIGVACDHAGKELKSLVFDFLKHTEFEVEDYGVSSEAVVSVDYPDYAAILCEAMNQGKISKGILICGTGIGMSIAANKFPGVRAALVNDEYTARMAKRHNDANVICLGSRTINFHRAVEMTKIWLNESFEGGRHEERMHKLREIEKKNFKPRAD